MTRGSRVAAALLLASTLLLAATLTAQVGVAQKDAAPAVEPPSAEDVTALATLDQMCAQCHERARVTSELRNADDWAMVIDQMAQIGATGTDEQFDQVLQYLLRHYSKADVNRARAADLVHVLGVSPEVAQAVIKRRAASGPFRSLDDLAQVPGVDAAKLAVRKARITF